MKDKNDGLFLSGKFFVIYGLLQVLGIASFEWTILLWIYLPAILMLALLLVADKTRVPPGQIKGGELQLPDVFRLNQGLKSPLRLKATSVQGCAVGAEFVPSDFLEAEPRKIQMSRVAGSPSLLQGEFFLTGKILGRLTVASLYVLVISPLGFWVRGKNISIKPVTTKIEPVHREVSEQEFSEVARRNHLFIGNRLWSRSQSPDQYYTSRKFQFSDSLRFIDHKKTAKFSEIMTKSFEELRNHRLIIALDLGRGMSGEIAGSSKHNFYLSAAVALAKHAVKFQDTVDFFAFSQKIHVNISGVRDLTPLRTLIEKSEVLRPQMVESNYGLINTMTTRLTGQRSILILLSDLSRPGVQSTLLKTMAPVCRKHLSVVLGMIDKRFHLETQIMAPPRNSLNDDDIGHLLYCYWLNEQNQLFQRRLSKLGGGSLALSQEDWLGVIERLYLHLRHSSHV